MKFKVDIIMASFLVLVLLICCNADNVGVDGDVIKRNFRQKAAERISHGFGKRAEFDGSVNVKNSLDDTFHPFDDVVLKQSDRTLSVAEADNGINEISAPRDTSTNQLSNRWEEQVNDQPMALKDDRNKLRTLVLFQHHLAKLNRNADKDIIRQLF